MHCYELEIFCLFAIFKMVSFKEGYEADSEGLFRKYFICSISFKTTLRPN